MAQAGGRPAGPVSIARVCRHPVICDRPARLPAGATLYLYTVLLVNINSYLNLHIFGSRGWRQLTVGRIAAGSTSQDISLSRLNERDSYKKTIFCIAYLMWVRHIEFIPEPFLKGFKG